jgi:hypothetical protein
LSEYWELEPSSGEGSERSEGPVLGAKVDKGKGKEREQGEKTENGSRN